MEELKIFKFEEFDLKKGGNILHSLLTEEFFFHHGFEALTKLVEIYATLLTANAEIERGFSWRKRIKADFRN